MDGWIQKKKKIKRITKNKISLTHPISLGRKNELAASIINPRRANTNPILASPYAIRMLIGSVMVMPMPTAEPLMAAMTGFLQR